MSVQNDDIIKARVTENLTSYFRSKSLDEREVEIKTDAQSKRFFEQTLTMLLGAKTGTPMTPEMLTKVRDRFYPMYEYNANAWLKEARTGVAPKPMVYGRK